MEVNCSFEDIVGGSCGVKRTDKGKTRSYKTVERITIPLLSCDKDITTHKSLFSFSEPSDEVDLILCRSALFSRPKDIHNWTICSSHRYNLGLGWPEGQILDVGFPHLYQTMANQMQDGQKSREE